MSDGSKFNDAEFADILSVLSEYLPPEEVVINSLQYLRNSDHDTIRKFIDAALCHNVVSSALPYIRRITAGADRVAVASRLVCFLDTIYPNAITKISGDTDLLEKFVYAIQEVTDELCKA